MWEYFLPFSAASALFILFKVIKVFQEEQPGRLLRVIEFSCATGFFPKHIIYVLKRLLKHVVG